MAYGGVRALCRQRLDPEVLCVSDAKIDPVEDRLAQLASVAGRAHRADRRNGQLRDQMLRDRADVCTRVDLAVDRPDHRSGARPDYRNGHDRRWRIE
jgi:hypothetical protein